MSDATAIVAHLIEAKWFRCAWLTTDKSANRYYRLLTLRCKESDQSGHFVLQREQKRLIFTALFKSLIYTIFARPTRTEAEVHSSQPSAYHHVERV